MTNRISYSKITILISVCIMLLSGCSNSEDVTPPVSPTSVSSRFPADQFTLTINGESISGNRTGVMSFVNNDVPASADYTYDMLLTVDNLYDISFLNTPNGVIPTNFPVLNLNTKELPVKISGDADNLTIEGDITTQRIRYIITGKIENPSSDSERHMYVNINKQLAESVINLAGIYEIQFDESSMYPSMWIWSALKTVDVFNKTLDYRDCATEFRNRANKAFVENSGYEAARIILNPDCTMNVYFKDAKTKEYIEAEGDFSYDFQDNYLIFTCDNAFAYRIKEWRQITDNPSEDIFPTTQYGFSTEDKFHSIYTLANYKLGEFLAFQHINEYTYLSSWGMSDGSSEISDMVKAYGFLCRNIEPYRCNYLIRANAIEDY